MTTFYKLAASATAALALMSATTASAAQPQRAGAMQAVRANDKMNDGNGQFEGLGGYIIPVVIVIALGVGLYFALDDDEDNSTS